MRGLPRQVQLHRPAFNGVATCNMQALPAAEALRSGLSSLIWAETAPRADDCRRSKGKGGLSAFGVFNFLKGFIHPDQAFFG